MNHWFRLKENMGDDPPFLPVGTEVSAKYRGAFCEAKISKVVRSVKYKVLGKSGTGGATFVPEDKIRGNIRLGGFVEVKNDKSQYVECTIVKIKDLSQYTVVFNDGDIATLRRTALCLKSGRHFAESETLDQLPLTHPEHFSTPVISTTSANNASNRRGRRNRLDDDSGDEELVSSRSKQSKSKEVEKEADIGKVVCVELSDNRKKLSRDNWFPGLIVSPTAQNSAVKIQIKNEYLIRSFKDGRYYTVPKKETQEFTRDIANRVENTSLKTAVEKALLFLDKDELPPHWDRDLLFGLGDSESSDSDNGSESDSSDDEPREEKDHFVAQLYKFMDDRGTPINNGPKIQAKDIDLYKCFKVVHKLGGYNRVTNHNQWKHVSHKLGFSQTGSTPTVVKSAYKRYLHSFEDFYRKLGCTMLSNPRSNRSRIRSGRSLIRDKDRSTPVQRDKSNEDKDSKDDESSDRKDEDSDEKDRDSDTKSVKDTQSSVVKSSVKVKDEKPEAKSKEEKSKSESETKVKDEDLRKDEKKVRTMKSSAENSPRSEKPETESKLSKKDGSKTNKDDKESLETKDSKSTLKSDRDNRMSKKLSALEDAKKKKPKSILGKVLTKKKNPKIAEKGVVKDHPSTLSNTRQKRSLKEKVKEIARRFLLKQTGQQDITKVVEEDSDVSSSVGQSQKPPDAEAAGKQSTRSKLKEEVVVPVTKARKQSIPSSGSASTTPVVPEPSLSEKKLSSSAIATSSNTESVSSTTSSVAAKSKKTEDDDSSPLSQGSAAAESAKKKLGKKKKDEETKSGTTSVKEETKAAPVVKPVAVGDKLKVYYGPPTQDSKKVTYEAKVLSIRETRNAGGDEPSKPYLVHYTGWNTRYDEWIPLSRIAANLTGLSEGSDNSGTDTAQCKSTSDAKAPPAVLSKSGAKSVVPPLAPNKGKSPGSSVRPPSSRILAKKSPRTRKISSQNTDGSDSENDFPEMEDSAMRTDESDDDNDFQNTSELSASSLASSEITTRSRREKQRKVPDVGKDSDNSNDSRKKDEPAQSRVTKKPGVLKRKNSDLAIKTKSAKDEEEENEEEDWQSESKKKNKSKADDEDSVGSAGSKKKFKSAKDTSKDLEETDLSGDNLSASKKKISTRSNKDLSFDDSSLPETPAEKTLGSSGKKIATRSTVIKRSPRCKSSLYVDDVDEDADVEDDDDDIDLESISQKKPDSSVSPAIDKKPVVEKDKDSSKKILKSKSPIISDSKDDSVDKKKPAKLEEESAKKETPSLSSLTENIYQRRYSGRRSTHLKNKLNREAEEKLDAKVSPKGREFDLAAIRSELKGLSKTSQGGDSDELVANDKTSIEDESMGVKPLMGSSFEDENDQSMKSNSSLIEDEIKRSSSPAEPLSAQKKSAAGAESSSKKSASSLESLQKNTAPLSDSVSKKSIPEATGKKVAESALKTALTESKKSEFPQKKTVASESVSKKISPTEFVPQKSVSPVESTPKKPTSAQESTPKKSAPEPNKKKPADSGSKRPDAATPNRFAVIEQPSSDVDDIYEFKDSDPFEFKECRSKSGSSDEKSSSKITPRRPVGPGLSTIASSPAKVDSHDSRNAQPVPTVTPKKKPFSDPLSSPPPLVSFGSEVPSVVSVTTSMKRKLNDDSSSGVQEALLKKKVAPIVSAVSSDAASSSEKLSLESKVEAVKSFLFSGPQNQSAFDATNPVKVEPTDVKPVVSSAEVLIETSSSIVVDSSAKKDKLPSSAALLCPVVKSEPDPETKKPFSADKIDLPEPSKTSVDSEKLIIGGDKITYDSAAGRKTQKTFGKQMVYSRDSKYPPPLVVSKSPFPGTVVEDKVSDSKTSSVLDSKVSAFDSARTKLSPLMFSSLASSKSEVTASEPIDVKPVISDPVPSKLPEKSSKEPINGITADLKPEIVTSGEKSQSVVSTVASIQRSIPKKYEESEAKTTSVLRKDYSLKQRKPVLSKEFIINEDSSSSDSSSNDFSALLTKKSSKTTPVSTARNFEDIFNSGSSDDDSNDDNNENNDDDDDDDEGNLQICLNMSSQEDIKKAIIGDGEDIMDDDNDADDDDDGDDDLDDDLDDEDDDDEDDDDDDDDEDDDDDDSHGRFLSRKEKKSVSAKKQRIPSKDKMDGSKDLKDSKHILSQDSVDEKSILIKEEKAIKEEDAFDLKTSEASDENDFIDNELLCEEIIPKSPPPSGALVDSGASKLSSSKTVSKSKEMPFASALSSNCSYSGSDKIYASAKNLSMFPPKTIKTLQPSSSKFRSSASTNNDRKEISSASESNDSSKVTLMDITPPMTPENCLSPVSNSPTEDHSNSSPAHLQDDVYKGPKSVDYDDSPSVLDIKSSKRGLDSSRKRRRSETESGPSSKYPSYDSSRKKIRSNQQSPRAGGSDSDDGSEPGTSTIGSSPSNSSITKPSKNNFFVELDPELDGTQRIAILQQKLQDLRKTYMNLKQELACIDRRRKKICRREREEKSNKGGNASNSS